VAEPGWIPDDGDVATYTAILEALLPGWAVAWDRPRLRWAAARAGTATPVHAPTPGELVQKVTGTPAARDAMAGALAGALTARGVMAIAHARSVTAWRAGDEDHAVLIVPGISDGRPVWAWQRGGRAGYHDRGDVEGAAEKAAAFLAEPPP